MTTIFQNRPLLLAPMEEVTDQSFRQICKKSGADIVYTEFINSEGLLRKSVKTRNKMIFSEEERPIGIQVYGGKIESVVGAAQLAAELEPDLIDINCGCWVKKIVGHGAGAGLLKDVPYMIKMISAVVNSTTLPVTVKTRIGWDSNSINIVEVSKMIEDTGVKALTIHCRTRQQGHKGEADWLWINRVKEKISIPVILNGGVQTAEDVRRAFQLTNADGVMIARGAIDNPWIFQQTKQLLSKGFYESNISISKRIKSCIDHLKISVEYKGERKGVLEFRKHYAGYFKGIYNASKLRIELMQYTEFNPIVEHIYTFLEKNKEHYEDWSDPE